MARNTSFLRRRITVKTKNGIETSAAVEANGSPCWRENTNAIQIKINDKINIDIFTGNILSPESVSPFLSTRVVSRAIDEKQSKYGIIYSNSDISGKIITRFNLLFITRNQPTENKSPPTIEFANHPKIGFLFQLNGFWLYIIPHTR